MSEYKVYAAIMSQDGTGAPTGTALDNTLGGEVVWTRDSEGQYLATLEGAFPETKVPIMSGFCDVDGSTAVWRVETNGNDDSVRLKTYSVPAAAPGDYLLNATFIEIRVYT